MHLTAGLHRSLQRHPDKIALVDGQTRLTFRQLAARVARLAGALQSLGVARGDRVAVLAPNGAAYVETELAVWWAGAVLHPVNTRWSQAEMAFALHDCGVRVLLAGEPFAALAGALRRQVPGLQAIVHVGPQPAPAGMLDYAALITDAQPVADARAATADLAAILYTGGTTGFPKGVMLSHGNLWASCIGRMADVPNPPDFVSLLVAPLFHVAGLGRLVGQLVVGGTCVMLPGFQPDTVLRTIAQEGISDMVLVPSMIQMLVDAPGFAGYDLTSLRRIVWGAAPIALPLLERAMAALPGVEFLHAYGMTETAASVSAHHIGSTPQAREGGRLRSAGRAGYAAELRIAGPDGREVPTGSMGEILARGPAVMMGYWNRPEETAQALRNGWLHTGDSGYMDDEGYLYVVDRIKDMIISGGENVYPAEVEETLGRHPAVATSAVIGIPDEKWGEAVHAVVLLREGAQSTADELRAHCRTWLGAYKCPKSFAFRSSLPLSAAGKVLKSELRKEFGDGV
ncbi:long-chain fatty acid--CoA ligase [Cupriavidus sp. 2TAF22]|uniref:acyl-CoA synthetase n=1 Tax=unclassified Cupriavidus TaxID=2640874 RepID=UPI003F9158BA